MSEINMHEHDLVALVEDTQVPRFPAGDDILLPKGVVGTIVAEYAQGEAFEVEFSGKDGQAYAFATLKPQKLFLLNFDYQPAKVAAVST